MKVIYKEAKLTGDVNYNDYYNKPSVNGVELEGNSTTEDLKVTWFGTQADYENLVDLGLLDPNTIYIINDDEAGPERGPSFYELVDKPTINGVIIDGKKSAKDLELYTKGEVEALISNARAIEVVPEKPLVPSPSTLYYVGPDSEDGRYYQVLYDKTLQEIDLGAAAREILVGVDGIEVDPDTYEVSHLGNIGRNTESTFMNFNVDEFGHLREPEGRTLGDDLRINVNNKITHSNTTEVPASGSFYMANVDKNGHLNEKTSVSFGNGIRPNNYKLEHLTMGSATTVGGYTNQVKGVTNLTTDTYGHYSSNSITDGWSSFPWQTYAYWNSTYKFTGYTNYAIGARLTPISYMIKTNPIIIEFPKYIDGVEQTADITLPASTNIQIGSAASLAPNVPELNSTPLQHFINNSGSSATTNHNMYVNGLTPMDDDGNPILDSNGEPLMGRSEKVTGFAKVYKSGDYIMLNVSTWESATANVFHPGDVLVIY